jgi:putative hydrolase of the HAD superfamily
MVDVDGVVVIRPDGRSWAADLEADLGVGHEDLQRAFFRAHFEEVVRGRAGLRERLALALAEIAPAVPPEALIAYWFAKDAHLDHALLADLGRLRAAGQPMHLATVQEHLRAAYLWDTLKLRDRFDAMHYAADLGFTKVEPGFYRAVEARTGHAAADLLLIDDSAHCVEAARAAGWRAHLWTPASRLADVGLGVSRNS